MLNWSSNKKRNTCFGRGKTTFDTNAGIRDIAAASTKGTGLSSEVMRLVKYARQVVETPYNQNSLAHTWPRCTFDGKTSQACLCKGGCNLYRPNGWFRTHKRRQRNKQPNKKTWRTVFQKSTYPEQSSNWRFKSSAKLMPRNALSRSYFEP